MGFKTAWAKILKRAGITRFRWHDMCHHFASRLVQRGVPLNTVRDLLGHSTVQMSLRYAHLAPDQRREAVAKVTVGKTLLISGPRNQGVTPICERPALTTQNDTHENYFNILNFSLKASSMGALLAPPSA
jgi:hypothetical protein